MAFAWGYRELKVAGILKTWSGRLRSKWGDERHRVDRGAGKGGVLTGMSRGKVRANCGHAPTDSGNAVELNGSDG
jgi:hypothetical protein